MTPLIWPVVGMIIFNKVDHEWYRIIYVDVNPLPIKVMKIKTFGYSIAFWSALDQFLIEEDNHDWLHEGF